MTFGNSVLAGEELVRTAIRSANYVAGVSGWRIDRAGNAEFNDGTFRGDVFISGPNGSLFIHDDPTFGSVIEFTDQTGGHWRIRANNSGSAHNFAIESVNATAAVALGLGFDNTTPDSIAEFFASHIVLLASGGTNFIDLQGAAVRLLGGAWLQLAGSNLAVKLNRFTYTTDGAGAATINGAFPAGTTPTLVQAFYFGAFGEHKPMTVVNANGLTGQVVLAGGAATTNGEGYIVYHQ